MTTLWYDIRYGSRMLARQPGFAAVVVLVVGISVAANTALFNALDQVYLRPLPVTKPRELVSVQFHFRHDDWQDILGETTYSTYKAYGDRSDIFESLIGYKQQTSTLRIGDAVEPVESVAVSDNYFSSLGLRPALGRLIVPDAESPPAAHEPIAVISHRLWRRRFEGRPDVIGKEIVLDNQALTIAGVTPAGFTGTIVGYPAEIFISLRTAAQSQGTNVADLYGIHQLGRLKPGIDREQAQAALRVLHAQIAPHRPGEPEIAPLVIDGSQGYVPRDAQVASYPLALFLGIAALVLIMACANIANLQLGRAVTRQKEIAIRQALGAGRRRIVRQLLVESLLLALMAGAFGIVLAVGLDRIVCAFLPQLVSPNMPPSIQVHLVPGLHLRGLLFALAISLGTGVAFGLAPALQLARRDVVPALKEPAGWIDLPTRRWSSRNLLVIGQIAVAVVVTVCSGLCLRSLLELKHVDPGFDPAHVLAVRIDQEGWLRNRPELRQFMENLQERIRPWPQVASTGLTFCVPLGEAGGMTRMTHIEGSDLAPGKKRPLYFGVVDPECFQTLGQTLLAGRNFTERDGPDTTPVMIVDEAFAQRYWPDQDPVEKHVTLTSDLGRGTPVRQIIGVVRAIKLRSIIEGARPWAYFPLSQHPEDTPVLLVRTNGNPKVLVPMLRKEAAAISPAPACDIRTVGERIWGLLLAQRILTGILNSFALVGLLLSAMGLYAVMAYAVRQRTREIGIRIALGAQGRHVLMLILIRGTVRLIAGLGLGLALSFAGTQVLALCLSKIRQWDKFFLHGVHTWDPLTYVGAALAVVAVTLLACYLPARRATRIDPMEALRYE